MKVSSWRSKRRTGKCCTRSRSPERRLYVAVGDPGVIDVRSMRRLETVSTEPGAHTSALDLCEHRLYVFMPKTHRATVFVDG